MFGPFVDKTDGVTLETGAGIITSIDHATTGIFLSKNGGTAAIRHQSVTASVLDAYGMFKVTLDTTDTDTVGSLDVLMAEAATFLPVHKTFMVLPANVYDSLMGTDYLQVDTKQVSGTAQTANDNSADINAILIDTAEIGAAGAGLSAVPYNSNWDADIQSECADALTAYDPPTKTEMDTGHGLLATPAQVATELGTYDAPTKAEMDTAHALLATPSQVNAQVLDVLQTDTFAEPSGVVAATSSLKDKICWLFALARNKITQTSTTQSLRNDADDDDIATSTVSDDGTTATRGEFS